MLFRSTGTKISSTYSGIKIDDATSISGTVFPNPSNGQFSLSIKTNINESMCISANVLDSYGRVVNKLILNNSFGMVNERLSLSDLNNGTYFILLKLNNVFKKIAILINK